MAISDTDQHIPFINIVADGVTSIDTFNTWRKKTNGIIKVINDGLITRYIADRAITPPKLSQGGPYWDLNGDFNTNGNNIRLGYAKTGNINAYIGSDRSEAGSSSLFFQTDRATGGSGSGSNRASIVRGSGASAPLTLTNIAGGINLNVDANYSSSFGVGSSNVAFFNKDGLAVADEIKSRNVKVWDTAKPYYRLTSNETGALSWNIESSGSRLYIRSGTRDITTTLTRPGTSFSRSGTSPGNIVVVNAPGHGYPSGSIATISGSIPSAFHGTYAITNIDADSFSYTTTSTGALVGTSGQTGNISVVLVPETPFQILNNASVIVGGRTTSTARGGDEFTVLGDSYLSGTLTVTGADTIIGDNIDSSAASLSIGKNRTAVGSSVIKLYSSKAPSSGTHTETASITRNGTDLILNNTGNGSTLYRQGTGGSHTFQIRNQGDTDWVNGLILDKDNKVTIQGTLKVVGGFDESAPIPTIATAKRLANAFGDGMGTIVTPSPNPGGPDISTDYGSLQSYFKFGTSISQDYFLVVGGARTAADRTGILIRSQGPTGSASINEWTPTSSTDNYNTDGLFIEKGAGLDGNATIYNSGTGTFTIHNRGNGDIKFVTTSTDGAKARLEIKGNTGAATFSNEVTSTRFKGPLTGDVTGNVTGNVTGDVTGNVTGDVTGTLLTAGSSVTNRIQIDSNQIRVNGNLDINKTRTNGNNAPSKQDTTVYDGASTTIAKFVGSTRAVEFGGDAVVFSPNKLEIKSSTTDTANKRARLQVGDWYVGQSSGSNGTKDFYIATADTSTISSPRLLINSTTGKITGTISNADVAASLSSVLPISNGGTGATTAAAALTALGAAPLNSPTFTGVPKVTTTPASSSSDTTIATTAFVKNVTTAAVAGANAATVDGTNATGTWPIGITGNAATATTAGTCTGNAASVTNGVYTVGNQSIAGIKTFSEVVRLSDAGIMFNSDGRQDTGLTWESDGVFNVQTNGVVRGTFKNTGWNGNVVGNVVGNVNGYLTGDSSGSSGSCRGNAATATNLSTNRDNWETNGTTTAVVGQLGWRKFGNGYTIFDASGGITPDNKPVNNKDASVPWTATYPTLMGWNGVQTHGVRVDNARVADSCSGTSAKATTADYATNAGNSSTTNKLDTTSLSTNGNQINPGDHGELALTYQNANGSTTSFYDTTIFDGKKSEIARFSGEWKTLTTKGNIVLNNGSPTLYLQDTNHRSAMIHVNDDKFYILRGNNNSTTWDQTFWPFTMNLNSGYTTFGGDIKSNGVIHASGDIIAFTSSDKNLKTRIKKIQDPLQKIAKLSGNTFKWDSKKQDVYEGEDVGVIAQEVEEVLPSAVITREDGTKAVRYEKIIPLLIESVKELHSLNNTLLKRIEQLEKQLK